MILLYEEELDWGEENEPSTVVVGLCIGRPGEFSIGWLR